MQSGSRHPSTKRTLVSLTKMCMIPRFCRRISKVGVHSIQGKENPTPPTWLGDSGPTLLHIICCFPKLFSSHSLCQWLVSRFGLHVVSILQSILFCSVRLLLLLAFISSCLSSCVVCCFCRHLSWYLLLAVWLKILAPLGMYPLKNLVWRYPFSSACEVQSPEGQLHGVHKQTPMTNKK